MEWMWQVASVALVLALLGGVLEWFRRRGMLEWRRLSSTGGRCLLSAEMRLNLGPHHALHLIRLGDRALLVAAYAGGCTLLAEAPWKQQALQSFQEDRS